MTGEVGFGTDTITDRATQHAEEQRLISAAQQGDMEAFDPLYRQHVGGIKRYIGRMAYNDPQLTEDLTHDAFLKAMRGIQGLTDDRRGMRPWLNTVAQNVCRNHAKQRSLVRFTELDLTQNEQQRATSAPDTNMEILESTLDLHPAIQAALNALPEDYAQTVIAVDINQMSYKEAAAHLGTEMGTISSRLHRGRAQLRSELSGIAAYEGYTTTQEMAD